MDVLTQSSILEGTVAILYDTCTAIETQLQITTIQTEKNFANTPLVLSDYPLREQRRPRDNQLRHVTT